MKNLFAKYRSIDPEVSPALDTLRGMSAIAVLIGHCFQIFLAHFSAPIFAAFGLLAQTSVMVFFVLSGLLITKSLTRNASRPQGFNVASYARDRFDRIYPPLLLALGLVVALLAIAPSVFPTGTTQFPRSVDFVGSDGFNVDFKTWLYTFVFLNGFATGNISANAPLWSLSYEVWYYVVAALFVMRSRWSLPLGLAILLALGAINERFLAYSIVWFAGAAVAIAHNHQVRLFKLARALALCAFAVWAIGIAFYMQHFPGKEATRILIALNVIMGSGVALSVHLMMAKNADLRYIAPSASRFSYTLYIIHYPILLFIYGIVQAHIVDSIPASLGVAAVSMLLALGLASVLASYVENMRPTRWIARLRASRLASAG